MIQPIKLLLTPSLIALSFTAFALATEPTTDSLSQVGALAQGNTQSENAGLRKNESPSEITQPAERPSKSDAEVTIDEQRLLEFVEQHQQPLLKLLRFMKKKQPQQYQQALKELARVKQRLTTLEKRDSESHAIELELWQVRSNLRMLVAEILVSEKDSQVKLKKQLHALVEKELDLETRRLTLEQKRMEQRLATVHSQLAERTENRDAALSKAIKTWENRAFKLPTRAKKQ